MSSATAIEVQDLTKTYRDGWFFPKRFTALKGVTLAVPEGEVFGLLGPNGAGKTTLVKILLGIIGKSAGTASLLGLPAGSLRARQLVGYLPEHLRMAGHLTPCTALEYFGALAGLSAATVRSRRDELLRQVGLVDRKHDRIRKFSKGMLQRLGLAQALLSRPRLLFLDEPTDGLDPRARAEMREIVRDLGNRGVTVFLNSHLLQEVEMTCQRVAILDRGELKYCGPVNEAGQHVRRAAGISGGLVVELAVHGTLPEPLPSREGVVLAASAGPDGQVLIRSEVAGQEQVDWIIDELRRSGTSICSLRRVESTLEEAFLAMVE